MKHSDHEWRKNFDLWPVSMIYAGMQIKHSVDCTMYNVRLCIMHCTYVHLIVQCTLYNAKYYLCPYSYFHLLQKILILRL